MGFKEFLDKQEKIYDEFRDTSQIEINGLVPQIYKNKGGYIIALRHSENITDGIEKFTEKISKVVSSIKYDKSNIHTTLSTYEECDNFYPTDETLEILTQVAKNNISLMKGIEIEYNEWLINQDSGIVAGIPNLNFFQNVTRIIGYAKRQGVNLKFPWGSHATINRFLEKISHEQTLELLSIFKNGKPLGISIPKYVDVGYFIITKESFKLNIYERFKI